MKKKFISLLLAFLMIVTILPVPALAQEGGAASGETQKLDYKYERIDGQDYLTVNLPANSVEIVKEPEDPYAMRPMSITNNVPTQDGAGHLINWGAGVLWYVYDKDNNQNTTPFPPKGKKYVVELIKRVGGKNVVIAKTEEITSAAKSLRDMDPNKDTTYQFTTTDAYVVGDEKLSLAVNFPVELDQNVIYDVEQKKEAGKLEGNDYNLVFLAVQSVTSNVYTAEWDTTTGALKPTLKGQITTGTGRKANVDVFDTNDKYGTIVSDSKARYIDEYNKDGKLIGLLDKYAAIGNLSIDDVIYSQGQNVVMNGKFLSYVVSVNGQPQEKPLNNKKGTIPSYTEMQADFTTGTFKQVKYPAYFYNLVGDNDHMWRFQMKEGLELKFNTGVGSATQGGQTGQDIGNTQTIAYGEKFDSALKGSFSDNTLTLPETTNLVATTLNKNNLKMKFIGWKLVQGLEVPVNPQKVETDGEGKQTLTAVTPDYADKAALETALKAADFKGFTEKNPVFYAIYGQTQGKANIKYVDDKGTELSEDLKIQGKDYKTEKLGELNEAVTADISEAPEFKDYAISKVEIEPATDAKYVDPATATIKFVYKAKATTDDKSSDQDYIKVTFNANEGHFGTTTDKTKDVYVLKDKATFADAKGKVSNPTKDNAFFKEWQTAATGGTKVADDKTLSTADETFYASYTTKAQGKASVEYLDLNGQAIEAKYRAEDAAKYPAEKEGNQDTKIPADIFTKDTAPKFVGYEFNRVEISPKDGTYALPATSTIKVYYNKVADVVPGTDPGTNKPNPKPEGYVTVAFQAGDNGTLTGETTFYVNPKADPVKTMAEITEPTIKANTGYKVADPNWKDAKNVALNKGTQITTDLTYTAQYTKVEDVVPGTDPETKKPNEKPDGYKTVTFDLDGKGTTTNETVFYVNPEKAVTLNPPTVKGIKGYTIKKGKEAWNPELPTTATKYAEDKTFVAQYTFSSISDTPVEGFNKVTFKPGDHGTLTEKSVWVQPNTIVDLTNKAPTVTANTGFSHIGWKPGLIGKFDNNSEVVAQYSSSISNEPIPGWSEILFNSGEHGRFDNGTRNVVWVDPKAEVKLDFMTAKIVPYINYSFDKWTDSKGKAVDLSVAKKYEKDTFFTGTYKSDISDTPEAGKVEINFVPGDHGKFADGAKTKIYVTEGKEVDLTEFAPTVIPNQGYGHSGWVPALKGTFNEATTITAQYVKGTFKDDELESIDVFGPKKLSYKEGEKLNLDGLKIVVKDKAGIQVTYDGAQAIKDAGFTITPANETPLTIKDHDGKPIKVSKTITEGQTTKLIEGQTVSTLSVSMNKSAEPTDVLARNLGKDPTKTTVTGKAPEGSVIKVTDIDGKDLTDGTEVKVGANGEFTITLKDKLEPGTPVLVTSTEPGKTESSPVVKQVFEDVNKDGKPDEQTPTPTIVFAANQNTVGSDGTTPTQTPKDTTTIKFTVVNKPTTVYVKYTVNGETKEESFDIGANDEATKTVDLQVKLPVGTEVQVLAKDADKTLSKPAIANVVRDANNDGKADNKTPLDKAKIDDIKAGADKILVTPPKGATELVISETDKNGDTPQGSTPLTLTKDGSTWKTSDGTVIPVENGKLVIPKGTFKLDEYNVVKVVAKGDPDTTTPSEATKTVGQAADTKAPAKPVVDPPIAGDTDVKVKTPVEPDAKTITVVITKPGVPDKEIVVTKGDDGKWKTPDGKEVPEENGKLVVPVTPKLDKGDTVTVTTTDDSGNPSEANKQTVVERQQLPKPTINPIKTGEKTVAGKAEKAATVDIYKKNDQGGFDIIAKDVGVSPDGSYTYNNADGFKDGDVIKVVSKKPGMIENSETTTVGVDTSGLDKAIQDGKDALDPEKGGKNNGTPEDKALEDAIKKGEEEKNKKPPKQEDVDKAQKDIEKAIEDKKAADDARDKLQEKINEANDKKNDPEYPTKPDDVKKDLDKAATDGQTTHDDKTKTKEDIDKAIKEIQDKIDEYNKQQLSVSITPPVTGTLKMELITVPGNSKFKVYRGIISEKNLIGEGTTNSSGIGTITFDKDSVKLKRGMTLRVVVEHDGYLSRTEIVRVI